MNNGCVNRVSTSYMPKTRFNVKRQLNSRDVFIYSDNLSLIVSLRVSDNRKYSLLLYLYSRPLDGVVEHVEGTRSGNGESDKQAQIE